VPQIQRTCRSRIRPATSAGGRQIAIVSYDGANFYVTPHVVFKADYQWFDMKQGVQPPRLGLGLNF